jgi:hypothetical protein
MVSDEGLQGLDDQGFKEDCAKSHLLTAQAKGERTVT